MLEKESTKLPMTSGDCEATLVSLSRRVVFDRDLVEGMERERGSEDTEREGDWRGGMTGGTMGRGGAAERVDELYR
jgi:hypothetical protein